MQSTDTTSSEATTAAFVLNSSRLYELQQANGIGSDLELAKVIGVDHATLYRVRTNKVIPSNKFMTKVALAFPLVSFDDLFRIEQIPAKAAA
jgi:DNA-binding XRE family transcriptional regulator